MRVIGKGQMVVGFGALMMLKIQHMTLVVVILQPNCLKVKSR